jgi:TrmH family RNA methyltransferase
MDNIVITSKDNEKIKEIKKLKEKKYREETNLFVVEGIKIVKEAIEYDADIQKIVISNDAIGYEVDEEVLKRIQKYEVMIVSQNVFESISDVKTPQGILAVIKNKENVKVDYNEDVIFILDNIQDPGNLGTIIRTLDAAGIKQLIVSNDTVDYMSPKVLRSTMGGAFRVNVIVADDLLNMIDEIKKNGFEVLATDLATDSSIYDIKYNKKAIVIGNEANGVSNEVKNKADIRVKIPMLGKAESLNAAVATSVIAYEYVRQRLSK